MAEHSQAHCMIFLSPDKVRFLRAHRQNGDLPAYVGVQAVPAAYAVIDRNIGANLVSCADCVNPGLPETEIVGMFLNWRDTNLRCGMCHQAIDAARG